jgi:hypothetical protein
VTTTVRETTAAPVLAGAGGLYDVVLIDPAETLEQAARDRVFKAGLHSYWDHSAPGDRPERTLRDLAGVLTEDARYEDGALRARMQVFAPYRPLVEEMRDHIGLSINGFGDLAEGVVTRLGQANSVDFVTRAGRGGRVLPVLEAGRQSYDAADLAAFTAATTTDPAGPPPVVTEAVRGQEGASVATETELRESMSQLNIQLREAEAATATATGERDEARTELDELRTQLAAAQATIAQHAAVEAARPVVAAALAESPLTEATRARLTREALRDLPMADGALDATALTGRVTEARTNAETELGAYLTEAGRPRGLGDTVHESSTSAEDAEYDRHYSRTALKG